MIFCECDADFQLLRFLGLSQKEITHAGDKGRVVSLLEKKTIGIGLVDEDPQSRNPKSMRKYKENKQEGDLEKLINKNKTLVVISPQLEKWYLNHAKKHQINPKNYKLPNDPNRLKDNSRYPRGNEFLKFQKDLFEACREFQVLKNWLIGNG